MTKYILDTCIFNWLLDGQIRIEDLPSDGVLVSSPVQQAELNATKCEERRAQLSLKFRQIGPDLVPAESLMFDVEGAGFDQAKFGDGTTYTLLKAALDAQKPKPNNVQDALIAEVALKNGMTLITADGRLKEVAEQFAIHVKFYC